MAGRVEEMVMSRHIATVSSSGNFIVWRNVGRRREEENCGSKTNLRRDKTLYSSGMTLHTLGGK